MEFMVCFCCFDINLRGKVTKKSLKTPTNGVLSCLQICLKYH